MNDAIKELLPLPLPALSFWRYIKLKHCLASGAKYSPSDRVKQLRPNMSRSLVLGKFFHELMEAFHSLLKEEQLSKEKLRTCFKLVVKRFEDESKQAHGAVNPVNLGNWPEVTDLYRKLSRLLDEHISRSVKRSWQTYTEETLFSGDKLLSGQLDAYFLDGEEAEVVDYKSGLVGDGELPREDYVNQLYFYAYLISETYGFYPRKLLLIDKNLESVEIHGSPALSDALATDMKNTLAIYNAQVNSFGKVTKTPSSHACVHCELKMSCDSYWEAAAQLDFPEWSQSAQGRQTGSFVRNKQGFISMEILVDKGTLAGKRVKIGGIFEGKFKSLRDEPGQLLALVDIRVRPNSNGYADMTDRTSIKVLSTVGGKND
ncbi:PD-(D/E)XK nuclease family protein [bacterium]|nr:PD-(D/E)XK nuclease family protein [bacterium]